MNAEDREAALALLRWYVEMGAEETIGFEPEDRLAPPPASMPPPAMPAPIRARFPRPVPAAPLAALTESLGEAAQSARRPPPGPDRGAAPAAPVAGCYGRPLKRTATTTVFIARDPAAAVSMLGGASAGAEAQ